MVELEETALHEFREAFRDIPARPRSRRVDDVTARHAGLSFPESPDNGHVHCRGFEKRGKYAVELLPHFFPLSEEKTIKVLGNAHSILKQTPIVCDASYAPLVWSILYHIFLILGKTLCKSSRVLPKTTIWTRLLVKTLRKSANGPYVVAAVFKARQ